MKVKNTLCLVLVGLSVQSISFANEIGVGHDNDIPGSHPPAETETTASESLLQEFLEFFGIDVE